MAKINMKLISSGLASAAALFAATTASAQTINNSNTNNNNSSDASASSSSVKSSPVTIGGGFIVGLDDILPKQKATGTILCMADGSMRVVTQGDSALGSNNSEAIRVKVEGNGAELKNIDRQIRAAKKAKDTALVAELQRQRDALKFGQCNQIYAPQVQTVATPAPTYTFTDNSVTNNYSSTLQPAAKPAPKPVVKVRKPVRKPVRRAPAKKLPVCGCKVK